jgi:hypothetical protein
MAEALGTVGVPSAQGKMRVQQIWHWLYVRGATDFDAMTSVSKELRAVLDAHFTLARPEVVAEQISVDGTRKVASAAARRHAGERPHEVECVYIPRPTAARSASRARSAARSPARSATPARSDWCAILRRARSSARSWSRATGWEIGWERAARKAGTGSAWSPTS